MKKSIVIVTTIVFATAVFALDIEAVSGDSFNKVMSKNRSSKKMEGANFVEVKNSDDLKKHGKKDLGLTIDGSKKVGTVYNYVEVKNAKVKKEKFNESKHRLTNKYNSKNKEIDSRNIGVKIKTGKSFNRGFKGKVHNTVKIDNSELD